MWQPKEWGGASSSSRGGGRRGHCHGHSGLLQQPFPERRLRPAVEAAGGEVVHVARCWGPDAEIH